MIKYAGKLKNTFHTFDTKTRKTCRYLLPCKYKFSGVTSKSDGSSISSDKTYGSYATMCFGGCVYGYCYQQNGVIKERI